MYDVHCHILPDSDDGSGSFNDSVEMALAAVKSGSRGIIATPHCNIPDLYENYWCGDFQTKVNKLNEKFKEKGIEVTVYPGQEISTLGEDDIASLLLRGDLITLNNSRYPLIEFDFYEREEVALRYIEALKAEGYVPIIAHPERYAFTRFNFESIRKMRSLGALIQVNSGSIRGELGLYAMLTAKKILREEAADFIASDAHSQYRRTPDLREAHETVCENYSYEYADLLFEINPLKVINNKEIR